MKTMQWLLRREFWENRGGFFWAPVVAGGVFLVLFMLLLAIAQAAADRSHIQIGLVRLDSLLKSVDPSAMQAAAVGVDTLILTIVAMSMFVTAIVVFFYSLGAFFDERKDRSILFWKSLPLSDRDTGISKVLSATVVAPAIGFVAGIVTGMGLLLVLCMFAAFHGQNLFGLVFWHAHPVRMTMLALTTLPLYAIWALPTVGWLMLCSSWARAKPFLWALGVPLGAGILVTFFDLMQAIERPNVWFWEHVVGRMLGGTFPGGWLKHASISFENGIRTPDDMLNLATLGNFYSALGSAELWVGAVAGAAMLVAATRLRRWRDEA